MFQPPLWPVNDGHPRCRLPPPNLHAGFLPNGHQVHPDNLVDDCKRD
jgi:hypothetical protein